MNKSSIHGGCLCGTVTFEVNPPFQKMVHCHCLRCRKGTGTGHATNLTVEPSQFRWLSGEEVITRYDLPTAHSFGKWFCSHCGCPVPRLTRNGKIMVIPAGLLYTAPPITPADHIFWAFRASWGCAIRIPWNYKYLLSRTEEPPNLSLANTKQTRLHQFQQLPLCFLI